MVKRKARKAFEEKEKKRSARLKAVGAELEQDIELKVRLRYSTIMIENQGEDYL